jgi:hypothetical protein
MVGNSLGANLLHRFAVDQCGRGGKDVTAEALANFSDPAAVANVMATRVRPKATPALWMWRIFLIAMPVLFVGLITGIGAMAGREQNAALRKPGGAEFSAANASIDSTYTPRVSGNTAEATALAKTISKSVATMRAAFFTTGKNKSPDPPFPTWCELHADHAVVLVHVPDLRKFNTEAKAQLCEVCWDTAVRAIVADGSRPRPFTVAVGVRGAVLYEQALVARIEPGASIDTVHPHHLRDSSEIRGQLVGLFAPGPVK